MGNIVKTLPKIYGIIGLLEFLICEIGVLNPALWTCIYGFCPSLRDGELFAYKHDHTQHELFFCPMLWMTYIFNRSDLFHPIRDLRLFAL